MWMEGVEGTEESYRMECIYWIPDSPRLWRAIQGTLKQWILCPMCIVQEGGDVMKQDVKQTTW